MVKKTSNDYSPIIGEDSSNPIGVLIWGIVIGGEKKDKVLKKITEYLIKNQLEDFKIVIEGSQASKISVNSTIYVGIPLLKSEMWNYTKINREEILKECEKYDNDANNESFKQLVVFLKGDKKLKLDFSHAEKPSLYVCATGVLPFAGVYYGTATLTNEDDIDYLLSEPMIWDTPGERLGYSSLAWPASNYGKIDFSDNAHQKRLKSKKLPKNPYYFLLVEYNPY